MVNFCARSKNSLKFIKGIFMIQRYIRMSLLRKVLWYGFTDEKKNKKIIIFNRFEFEYKDEI